MNDAAVAWIRTVVPLVVGTALTNVSTWLFDHHVLWVKIDTQAAAVVATGIVVGVYYSVFHWLEQKWPAAGRFLGAAKRPVYHA